MFKGIMYIIINQLTAIRLRAPSDRVERNIGVGVDEPALQQSLVDAMRVVTHRYTEVMVVTRRAVAGEERLE